MKILIAVVALLAALHARAADYPKKPDDKDKLCEVMGEQSPNATISPLDRLWFNENCECAQGPDILADDTHGGVDVEGGPTVCGNRGSKRFKSRMMAIVRRTEDGNRKLISSIRTMMEQWEEMTSVRNAYRNCTDAVVRGVAPPPGQTRWCGTEIDSLSEACAKTEMDPQQCRSRLMPFRLPEAKGQ